MKPVISAIRALLFYLGFACCVIIFGTISCILGLLPLPHPTHQRIVSTGNALGLFWFNTICGVRVDIKGLENLPDSPAVFLSNHESTWETFYLQRLLKPVSTTIKRELFYIPFFGWGLYFMRPISIDRGNPKAALKKIQKMGQQRLSEGNNLLIFPEGTRKDLPEKPPYARSGASIAISAKVPVVPIAHNGGTCWPNSGYLKRSGTIHVVIGEPIPTEGASSRTLTAQVQAWVEEHRANMPS